MLPPTAAQLEAYLDEALPAEEMADIEKRIREMPELVQKLAVINERRDSGVHSLGEIWRRNRLSCPTRNELGSYLLGAMDDQQRAFVHAHLEAVGCRYCQANVADLQNQSERQGDQAQVARRAKFFQSSAGILRSGK